MHTSPGLLPEITLSTTSRHNSAISLAGVLFGAAAGVTGFAFGSSPALNALIAASSKAASGGAPSGAGRGRTLAGERLSFGAGTVSSIGSSICLMSPSFLTKSLIKYSRGCGTSVVVYLFKN